jgi:hypothetical protein
VAAHLVSSLPELFFKAEIAAVGIFLSAFLFFLVIRCCSSHSSLLLAKNRDKHTFKNEKMQCHDMAMHIYDDLSQI